MELESVIKQLNKKFSEPLPEFYRRRIIFWNDEDQDFKDNISELKLEKAKVIELKENNNFAVKKLLTVDDLDSNFLVYNPFIVDMEDDWLLDIKLYSEDFRADQLSMWMQEMNIAAIPDVRETLKGYKQFLKAASRRKVLAQFGSDITNVQRLHMAMLASILKTRMNPKEIIKSVMKDGPDIQNEMKVELLKYSASTRFWNLVRATTGYTGPSDIDKMDTHIVLSAVSQTMPERVLSGLEAKYSGIHSAFCYDLISEWIHSDSRSDIYDILRRVESELRLRDRFKGFEIEDLSDTEILPVIDEVILEKLMQDVIRHTINADTVVSVVEKRRTMAWHGLVENYYSALYWAAKMLQFSEKYAGGFHLIDAKKLWDEYCKEYYFMDTYYRQFYGSFNKCINKPNHFLDDDLKNVASEIEKLYKNWYLSNLSQNWTNVAENELKTTGSIFRVPQQTDFYNKYIRPEDNKVYVIISDAMRYEVAASLADQLRAEAKSDVTLNSQQAVFPTITKFGMAALLPHRKLNLVEKSGILKIMADGKSTDANNREDVLKGYNPNSITVKYKDIILMKREERRNLVRGMQVVYIYHDTIDHTSHHDEQGVFNACDTAINEIKSLVTTLVSDMHSVKIIITSDHGFLYTYEPLEEDDKLNRAEFKKDITEQDRRHIITDMDASPDFMIPVKGFYNEDGYQAFSPRENIRIKGSGSLNFVHGGASLQEMVVPVIEYRNLRSTNKTYLEARDRYDTKPVTIALLSSSRKVSNMIFNLNFYQKEAVADNYISCTYKLFLVDAYGNTISDVQRIVADRTSKNIKEREFRCTFNLKQQAYDNHALYYLMIQDEDGLQIPVKEEIQIDISMSFDDFNFFD
ncbi:MAG: BREX-1 system phosphatase PglZ type A [Faecalicoccus sp.]|nr:BREX-1 system phosphatase PglZ type A [Faecalicoccus sp.]